MLTTQTGKIVMNAIIMTNNKCIEINKHVIKKRNKPISNKHKLLTQRRAYFGPTLK